MSQSVDVVSTMTQVLEIEGQAILKCAGRLAEPLQKQNIEKALALLQATLDRGGKIIVTGVGKSGKVAQKIAATLSSTGNLAIFLHPTEGLHGDLGVVAAHDAVLALSHTGNTDELVRLLPSLKALQVKIVGIGGNAQSRLAEQCDAWIDASIAQEACPHNLAPTTSTTLSLALGDAIAVTLMKLRRFDAHAFAQNHPGGSLGRRLHLRVSDIMHQGETLGVVTPGASMDEVVVASTRCKLGGVLVGDQRKLLGLITDGDIRRALQHREKFFTLRADQIMTRNPITVAPDMMAVDALQMMENRPSQISVLPVVDPDQNWLGMVRLHDLIQSL